MNPTATAFPGDPKPLAMGGSTSGVKPVGVSLRVGATIVVIAAYMLAILTAVDTEWAPLVDSGAAETALVASASVALGLLWGRWWALLAGSVFFVVHVALDWDAVASALSASHLPRNYYWGFTGLWTIVGSVALAACIGLGVGLRRLSGRRAGPSGSIIERTAIVIAVVVLFAVTVASFYSQARTRLPVDIAPDPPVRIDERAGEIGGVGIGSDAHAVSARFGAEVHGAARFRKYPTVTFFLTRVGKVRSFFVDNQEAETMLGVNVGDSLNLARDQYPALHCERQYFHDDNGAGDPYCETPRGADVSLLFFGNPIESISVRGRRLG